MSLGGQRGALGKQVRKKKVTHNTQKQSLRADGASVNSEG